MNAIDKVASLRPGLKRRGSIVEIVVVVVVRVGGSNSWMVGKFGSQSDHDRDQDSVWCLLDLCGLGVGQKGEGCQTRATTANTLEYYLHTWVVTWVETLY